MRRKACGLRRKARLRVRTSGFKLNARSSNLGKMRLFWSGFGRHRFEGDETTRPMRAFSGIRRLAEKIALPLVIPLCSGPFSPHVGVAEALRRIVWRHRRLTLKGQGQRWPDSGQIWARLGPPLGRRRDQLFALVWSRLCQLGGATSTNPSRLFGQLVCFGIGQARPRFGQLFGRLRPNRARF